MASEDCDTARLRPAPACEPPYDVNPVSPAAPPAQGTLALDFPLPTGAPAIPAPARLRVVPAAADDAEALLPPAGRWAARLVQAVVEVLAGHRPAGQLVRWTDADVYAEVTEHIRLRGPGRLAARRGHGERPQVLSVHVCEPGAGVAEAAVRIREGDRSRAVALRLEATGGRWLCTHLQLG